MKRKKGATGFVGFKFYMHKAYYRINLEVLIRFWFLTRVVSLFSQCYSILRGQASILLSPYLYILFVEILSRMLHKLKSKGKIHGIKIGSSSLPISHLFFADDILIFCRANREKVKAVAKCMQQYCDWIGQLVNKVKSGCFFSKNVTGSLKASVKNILSIKELANDAKYLGNLLFIRQ